MALFDNIKKVNELAVFIESKGRKIPNEFHRGITFSDCFLDFKTVIFVSLLTCWVY